MYRKATRAVLVLTPLLGLQYILFPFRLKNDEATYVRDAVLVASAAVTSFQVGHSNTDAFSPGVLS